MLRGGPSDPNTWKLAESVSSKSSTRSGRDLTLDLYHPIARRSRECPVIVFIRNCFQSNHETGFTRSSPELLPAVDFHAPFSRAAAQRRADLCPMIWVTATSVAMARRSFRHPNIDQLAAEGRRFTDAHSASAVCTPSRYALMTGEYPLRAMGGKGTWGPLPPTSGLIIDTETLTIGKVFKNKGYATACLGEMAPWFQAGKE